MNSAPPPVTAVGASAASATPVCVLSDITKSFAGNKVLKGVDLELRAGSITALLGANGAGKSTLIKILAGLYTLDSGNIVMGGQATTIDSPSDAQLHGIQTVHQRIDENLVPGLSVAENLCFEEIVRGQIPAVASLRKIMPRAREIAQSLSLNWSDSMLRQDVYELGIADSQLLLLARALIQKPKVLILDEPTSTLSDAETRHLFKVIHRMRDDGVAILYVSHRLSEIKALADELVVLRDGRIIDVQSQPIDLELAVKAMLGESVMLQVEQLQESRGERTCLELRDVQLQPRSEPIALDLRYGEVTGIVGLIGAGKSELARGIFGATPFRRGTMTLDGKSYAPRSTYEAVHSGIYLVPEDRAAEAMLPGWSVAKTSTLPFTTWASDVGILNFRRENRRASEIIDDFKVVSTGGRQPVDSLSGGNQQKVVVGRWLAGGPKVLLLDEPFRGVDLGARRDISQRVREMAHGGACAVVLSSDVSEIKEIADRIIILVEGMVAMDAYTSEVDHDAIVKRMSEVQTHV